MNEKNPKILFVMHLPPPVHGASMVGQYIHDSALVNDSFDCHYVNLTTAQSLEDVGKGGFRKLMLFMKKLHEIKKNIRKVKPDMIYITPNSAGGPFYKDFVVVQLCKLFCKHVVLHFHNKGVQTRQDNWLDNKLYKHYFKQVKVILLADGLYDDVKKYISKSDVYICPNGIPDDVEIDLKNKAVHAVPNILWLTNLMRTKGLLEFLEALEILKQKGIPFHVDFVGGFTNEISEEEFNAIVQKKQLVDTVVYRGKKYGEEKDCYFRDADMFVLPSYTEAFPLTILEAMKYGLPVVATNVGGVSSLVEDGVTGLLVGGEIPILNNEFRPSSVEIAEKLEYLLTDEGKRCELGENGNLKYHTSFTINAFEKCFVSILDQISSDIIQ